MALKAKKPEQLAKRLKVVVYGPPGVGKTTFAVQFPTNFVINGERGADNYADLLNQNNSMLLQPEDGANDITVILQQLEELASTKHDFRTVTVDSGTRLYDALLEKGEKLLGTEFGRHYGYADKCMRRLFNRLMQVDMNVIYVSHWKAIKTSAKGEAVESGHTFDGWKALDRDFDLALQLCYEDKKRYAIVTKSRISTFPLGDKFEWSYEAVRLRYEKFAGPDIISRPAAAVPLATAAQVEEMKQLLAVVRVPDDWSARVFSRAGVDDWEDLKQAEIAKCIEYCRSMLPPPGEKPPTQTGPQSAQNEAAATQTEKPSEDTPNQESPRKSRRNAKEAAPAEVQPTPVGA